MDINEFKQLSRQAAAEAQCQRAKLFNAAFTTWDKICDTMPGNTIITTTDNTTGNDFTQWLDDKYASIPILPTQYPQVTKKMMEDDIYKWQPLYEQQHPQTPKQERRAGMETLFWIYIVSKDRKVLITKMIVAENADDAKLEVDIHSVLRAENLKMKDVSIICQPIGDVKVRKEVQKVKVVDKDEE